MCAHVYGTRLAFADGTRFGLEIRVYKMLLAGTELGGQPHCCNHDAELHLLQPILQQHPGLVQERSKPAGLLRRDLHPFGERRSMTLQRSRV